MATAQSQEKPPPYEAIGMKHNNSPTAHSIGDHAETMPTLETDCGVHFSVFQPRSLGFLNSPSGRARGLADHHEVFPTFNCDCGGAVCVYGG